MAPQVDDDVIDEYDEYVQHHDDGGSDHHDDTASDDDDDDRAGDHHVDALDIGDAAGTGPAGRGGGDMQLGVLARTGVGGYGWLLSPTMITLACGLGLLWVSRLYGRRPQRGEDVPQA